VAADALPAEYLQQRAPSPSPQRGMGPLSPSPAVQVLAGPPQPKPSAPKRGLAVRPCSPTPAPLQLSSKPPVDAEMKPTEPVPVGAALAAPGKDEPRRVRFFIDGNILVPGQAVSGERMRGGGQHKADFRARPLTSPKIGDGRPRAAESSAALRVDRESGTVIGGGGPTTSDGRSLFPKKTARNSKPLGAQTHGPISAPIGTGTRGGPPVIAPPSFHSADSQAGWSGVRRK
jgi:hypothetical protein